MKYPEKIIRVTSTERLHIQYRIVQQHCHTENDSHRKQQCIYMLTYMHTKRVTSSRRLILVVEDGSNGLEGA